MIPKIIHYSWFSGEPFPDHIKILMSTWKEKLPDYKFILWDMNKLKETQCQFALEAISVRKWAFASDFIRLYAIYNYGGIWLDTDIEVFKSFDPFLDNMVFIGGEANFHNRPRERWLTSHCFGAIPKHPFIKDCLDYYTDRHFIRCKNNKYPETMRYDMTIIPQVQAVIAETYGYDNSGLRDNEQLLEQGIHVYPSDYFDCPRYHTMKNVVCIHRASGAWRPGNNGIPDYSASNPLKKDLRYLLKKINDLLEPHGYAIAKFSKRRKNGK